MLDVSVALGKNLPLRPKSGILEMHRLTTRRLGLLLILG
jgi:hypothetical protein